MVHSIGIIHWDVERWAQNNTPVPLIQQDQFSQWNKTIRQQRPKKKENHFAVVFIPFSLPIPFPIASTLFISAHSMTIIKWFLFSPRTPSVLFFHNQHPHSHSWTRAPRTRLAPSLPPNPFPIPNAKWVNTSSSFSCSAVHPVTRPVDGFCYIEHNANATVYHSIVLDYPIKT